MSVEPRPADTTTVDFLQLGMPFVEFAPVLLGGGFGPFRSLGIIDSAEIAKELELATLRSAQSGTSVKVRELVRLFEASIAVTTFAHTPENMQLIFASSTLVPVSGGAIAVVGDPYQLTDDPQDFLNLANANLQEGTVVPTADLITDEAVGTGQGGTFGETTGDFSLDFKIAAILDVSAYIETTAGVPNDRTGNLVAGTTPMAGEIAIEIGAVAAGGQITYPAGEAPVSGVVITATYEPTFAFVLNTDFTTEPKQGRIRHLAFNGGTDALRNFQPMEAAYTYDAVDRNDLQPYTQFVFAGQTRIRLLTDVGINMLWTIPSSSVRLTDDPFTFNRDEFQASGLRLEVLDAGGQIRFGTMQLFEETP